MNHKLLDLWVRAHVAERDDEAIYLDDEPCLPLSVIETLRFVYNAFGLTNPLLAPTPEQLKEYEEDGKLPCYPD
jgi:hypothetical protein